MAKQVAERVAEYRQRQRQRGLATISLQIPEQDVELFRELAAKARAGRGAERSGRLRLQRPELERGLSSAQRRRAATWIVLTGAKIDLENPSLSLSDVLARCIAEAILRAGWPIGLYLGSESELRERFGVGRNLLGKAIRVLEHQSIARMRRGSSGGLFSDRPSLESIAYMAGLYLEYRGTTKQDLLYTRREIQRIVIRRCIERLNASSRRRLEEILEEEQEPAAEKSMFFVQRFHSVLAQLTGDPVLELLTDLLLNLVRNHLPADAALRPTGRHRLPYVFELHRGIANAILARDEALAQQLLDEHIAHIAKSIR
jgi:DNA-binding FadR family transcriptional regulator